MNAEEYGWKVSIRFVSAMLSVSTMLERRPCCTNLFSPVNVLFILSLCGVVREPTVVFVVPLMEWLRV